MDHMRNTSYGLVELVIVVIVIIILVAVLTKVI